LFRIASGAGIARGEWIALRSRLVCIFICGFRCGELYGNSVLPRAVFSDTDYFRALRCIESCGRAGIRERDIEKLAFPIASAGCGEKQAVAGNVNALANFFKGLGTIYGAHVNLRGNFRAFAAAAFYLRGIFCGSFCFGFCGSDRSRAHLFTLNSPGCMPSATVSGPFLAA
jgi:hypothetical protein